MKPFYPFKTYSFILILAMLCCSDAVQAQFSFTNQSAELLQKTDLKSGVAMGIADMDGDGLDDIIRLDQAQSLWIDYQVAGADSMRSVSYGRIADSNQWTLTIGDVDNDGVCEIMTGGVYDEIKVLKYDAVQDSYVTTSLPGNTIFAQGSNFADINNDGFLDAFVCHDDGASRIWGNNGNGTFSESDQWIDMATVPVSDNSGNYGSVWADFDHDGDIDLYIAKCRQGVSDPRDPRRINALYVNDGNNNYTEMAAEYGLKIGAQSWTAEFQDIDNDGDFDCFITNHDTESQLLENDGEGYFTDITAQSGIDIDGLAIQGLMKDFDNDGFVDILVSGTLSYLYHNNGDKTFTLVEDALGTIDYESCAVGDVNNDGFLDIYTGYAQVFNSPSNIDDALWVNDGNNNNYLKVQLLGTASNLQGVGAQIEIFGAFGRQIREVRAGESYGITNSLVQHFGLGQATEIEFIQVLWPSGNLNIIRNPNINQQLVITENECSLSTTPSITAQGPTAICSGESVVLEAAGGQQFLWSTGATSQSITVTEPGVYTVFVGEDGNCFQRSEGVEVVVDPVETPMITVDGATEFCEGQTVLLSSSDATSYMWSNGEQSQSIEIGLSGTYNVTIEGLCDSYTSEPIDITVFDAPDAPQADDVNIPDPGPVTLTATGDSLRWYDATGNTLIGTGNTLDLALVSVDTSFLVDDRNVFAGETANAGEVDHAGNSLYSGDQFNGGIIFQCFETFTLNSAKVYTDAPGERIIELRAADGETVLQSVTIDIPIGINRIDIGFEIEPGTYLLTTNEDQNNLNYGFNSPRLQRTGGGITYPIRIGDLGQMEGSPFGMERYYYFYDWEVQAPSRVCASEQTTVEVTIGTVGTQSIEGSNAVRLYPNPGNGIFYLDVENERPEAMHLRIMDTQGRVVWEERIAERKRLHERSLDLQSLPAGMYWLQLQQAEATYYGKLLIQ
ncbi:MAG: FG-GAP-like repeat-containing protein [Bacteroidota bacterium]